MTHPNSPAGPGTWMSSRVLCVRLFILCTIDCCLYQGQHKRWKGAVIALHKQIVEQIRNCISPIIVKEKFGTEAMVSIDCIHIKRAKLLSLPPAALKGLLVVQRC